MLGGTIRLGYKNFDNSLYVNVCKRYGMPIDEGGNETWINNNPTSPLRKIMVFNIFYQHVNNRIWFVDVTVDVSLLYNMKNSEPVPSKMLCDLEDRISSLYKNEFGFDIKDFLPDRIDMLREDETGFDVIDRHIFYLEYCVHLTVSDADRLMDELSLCNFSPEQLDITHFDTFKIRNATPAFTINKLNHNTVRLCVKCEGTALKSLYSKYKKDHIGIPSSVLLNKENALLIFEKQIKKYTKPHIINELNRADIYAVL